MSSMFLLMYVDELAGTDNLSVVPMEPAAHDSLSLHFDEMAAALRTCERIPYDVGYNPEPGEAFEAEVEFDGPLAQHAKLPHETTVLDLDALAHASLKYLVQVIVNDSTGVLDEMRFQVLDNRRKLRPGRGYVFWQRRMRQVVETGLLVGDNLDAIYAHGTLVFRSYTLANRFLSLKAAVADLGCMSLRAFATTAEDKLTFLNMAKLEKVMTSRLSRLLIIVRDRDLLSKYTATELQAAAKVIGLPLTVTDGKLVIPSDARLARLALKLLAQQLLKCPVSADSFETNSARQLAI